MKANKCFTELHSALFEGKTEKERLNRIIEIINNGGLELINERDEYGKTVLHYAVKNCYIWTMIYLLINNAQKDIVDNDGRTPLHIAIENSKEKNGRYIAFAYINIGNEINLNIADNNGKTVYDIASENKDKYMVDFLSKKNINIKYNV
jgi:ankyrin repeat protein